MTEAQKEVKRKEVNVFTKEIRELKPRLFKAIDEEQYEQAAKLRDKIKVKQTELLSLLISL